MSKHRTKSCFSMGQPCPVMRQTFKMVNFIITNYMYIQRVDDFHTGVPKHLIKAYEMHSTMDLRSLLTQNLLGFYFRDAERYEASNSGLERCRFIMNAMMMQLFPDDEEFGSRWVRSLDE